MQFAKRVGRIQPSATLEVIQKVAELKESGRDIISLSAGEPSTDTPLNIKAAAIEAIHEGFTRYTSVDGCNELKDAIIRKYERDNNLSFERSQVIVSTGAKQSIANMILALIEEGDEVIIPAPYWVSYVEMVALAGGTPVIVESDIAQSFKVSAEQIEQAITPNTKLIILNNPSNPSGSYYHSAELKAIGEMLLGHPNIMILSDDIYELLLWGPEQYSSILNVCPQLGNRTVVINGVSKGYSMTGWRIGYALGPDSVIRQMKKIQSQTTSCPSSISQAAAIEALETHPDKLTDILDVMQGLHDYTFKRLKQIDGIEVVPSSGTFYTLPRVSDLMQKNNIETDVQFCTFMLEKANVAMIPGSAFGAPGHVRISFATTQSNLNKAFNQIEQALQTENSY